MADGPCGEQFKAAFSCFVFSEAEPKGMDCVDRFKGMQDCFREHPDVYGEGTSLPPLLFSSFDQPTMPQTDGISRD
jgi:intermembrane space import and assembly protein 40